MNFDYSSIEVIEHTPERMAFNEFIWDVLVDKEVVEWLEDQEMYSLDGKIEDYYWKEYALVELMKEMRS
jgi:hypothetical protein